MAEFGKSYATDEEYQLRYQAFKDNLSQILSHDSQQEGFEVGLNEMSDWTQDEYNQLYNRPERMQRRVQTGEKRLPTTNLAREVDWVADGHVGPARN